jgi:CheY-like chemotaxis protein
MPGKSGYEVCEAIKADPDLRHIPVLLLTGTFEAFDEARAARIGAAGHIAKPFESQRLVEQVKRLLVQSEQQRSAAPSQPAPAAAAAAKAAPGDSFDFFNDDLPETAAPAASSDDAFALDENDSSFAFGDSELSGLDPAPAARPRPPAPPAGERTVAILPDQVPPAARPSAVGRFEELAIGGDEAEFEPLEAPATDGSDPFEFDSVSPAAGRDGSLRVDSDDLAQATVLDPNGASGFDVSATDLQGPLSEPPRVAARARGEKPAAPRFEPVVAPEDSFSGLHEEIADAAELAPLGDDELDESSLELLEPPRTAQPARTAAPAAPAAAKPRTSPLAGAEPLLEALAPQLRAQLHDTLEKIAWESFSSVTEQIVRQALERVETIAWEVIPQMAETLVREEIRRLKGEAD